MGIKKCKVLSLNPFKKSAKKFNHKKLQYTTKTFAHSNKNQNLHFSVTVSLTILSHEFFSNFFKGFEIPIKFCFFIPILHF